ncbi:MAG: hypothetical protein ACOX0Z_02375 [Candidatus Nanosyncoccaceae bacterium]
MISRIFNRQRQSPSRQAGNRSGRRFAKFQRGNAISSSATRGVTRADFRVLSRRRSRVARLLVFSLSVVVITIVIVTQTIHNPVIKIDDVSDEVNVEKYTTILIDYFDTNPTERLKLALNIDSINSFLSSSAPEIERIKSIATGFGRSEIKLIARRPVVMWESSGKKYYVDALGKPFTVNYFSDPDIIVDDRSGVSLSSVDRVANDNFISFIGQSVSVANQSDLTVKKVIIPPLTTRQLEIYVNNLQFPIKMTTSASVVRQINDASRTIKFLQEHDISPSYIDVRVERKVYYK